MSTGQPATGVLRLDGWAGRTHHRLEVVGETPTRYRVRMMEYTHLPGGRRCSAGDVVLVPKYAVILDG